MPEQLTALLSEYLLAAYVVAGLIVATLLGTGIGSTGLTAAIRRARRYRRAAQVAVAQQRLAEEALEAATHPIGSTDDRPETDLEALMRVVTDPPAPDPKAWVWDTTPAAPAMCGDLCPHGHGHRCARSPKHTYPHRDVKQKGEESCTWWAADVSSAVDL